MLQAIKCPNCDHEEAIHFTAIGVISCGACGYREERNQTGQEPKDK